MPTYPEPHSHNEHRTYTDTPPSQPHYDEHDRVVTSGYAQGSTPQNQRMIIYSVIILIVSIVIFAGIGFAVFVQLDDSSADTANESTTLVENSSESNEESAQPEELLETGEVSEDFVVDQVYENAFLPGTSIAYALDWNYTNETEASEYTGLIKRTITLTKGTSEMTITFRPKFIGGCTGFESDLNRVTDFVEAEVSRFSLSTSESVFYYFPSGGEDTESSDCVSLLMPIATTIATSDTPDYAANFPDEATVRSMVVITLESDNPDHIAEADAMITESRFNLAP